MKLKTTAIALAVAGIVAAPVAVQAGADEVYASARVGLKYTDTKGAADFDVANFASRFGMRGETDLGNGLTGFGRYEFGVNDNTAKETAEDANGPDEDVTANNTLSTRHLYVGLKGGWGEVLMGQTYHTWYNFVSGPLDIPWWHSLKADLDTVGRTASGLTYTGGSGNFGFGITGYFSADGEETAPDALEAALSFAIGGSTIGLGIRTVDEDGAVDSQGGSLATDGTEDLIGLTWSGIGIGDTSLALGYQQQDKDKSLALHWDIGNFYLNTSMNDLDLADRSQVDITLGYTQSLGRKTTMYYEVNTFDADSGDSDDDYMAVMAVLKYDII